MRRRVLVQTALTHSGLPFNQPTWPRAPQSPSAATAWPDHHQQLPQRANHRVAHVPHQCEALTRGRQFDGREPVGLHPQPSKLAKIEGAKLSSQMCLPVAPCLTTTNAHFRRGPVVGQGQPVHERCRKHAFALVSMVAWQPHT